MRARVRDKVKGEAWVRVGCRVRIICIYIHRGVHTYYPLRVWVGFLRNCMCLIYVCVYVHEYRCTAYSSCCAFA